MLKHILLILFIIAILFSHALGQSKLKKRVNSDTPEQELSQPLPEKQEEQSLVPKLLAPAEGAEMDNNCGDYSEMIFHEFRWTEVPGASRYHLYVIGPPAARGVLPRKVNPAIDDSDIKYTIYWRKNSDAVVVPGNYEGWRWKVRAKVNGKWGPWSVERTFRIESWDTDCGSKKPKLKKLPG